MNTNDGFQHQRSHARSIQSLRLGSKCVFCPETEDIPKISQTIQSKMVDREIITDQGWTTYVGLRVFNFTINLTACPKGFEASFEDIERICGWNSHRFTCFKNVCISMQIIYCKSTCFCATCTSRETRVVRVKVCSIYGAWWVAWWNHGSWKSSKSHPVGITINRSNITGWWFQTCVIFHFIYDNMWDLWDICHPSQLTNSIIFQRGRLKPPTSLEKRVSFHCHVWLPETISSPNQNGPLPCFRNLHCSVERPEYHTWHSHSKKFHKETTRELGYHSVIKHGWLGNPLQMEHLYMMGKSSTV